LKCTLAFQLKSDSEYLIENILIGHVHPKLLSRKEGRDEF